jgi:hypothetical protein
LTLPGIFWANLLGAPYVGLIGRDRLISTPAQVLTAGENVLLVVHEEPDDWALASAVSRTSSEASLTTDSCPGAAWRPRSQVASLRAQ